MRKLYQHFNKWTNVSIKYTKELLAKQFVHDKAAAGWTCIEARLSSPWLQLIPNHQSQAENAMKWMQWEYCYAICYLYDERSLKWKDESSVGNVRHHRDVCSRFFSEIWRTKQKERDVLNKNSSWAKIGHWKS